MTTNQAELNKAVAIFNKEMIEKALSKNIPFWVWIRMLFRPLNVSKDGVVSLYFKELDGFICIKRFEINQPS